MTIYNKGRRKEYAIMSKLKLLGFDIVQRTAGSHSIIDIIGIRKIDKRILLIQSKRQLNKEMDYINKKVKNRIEKQYNDLNGYYKVIFKAL